MPAVFREKHVEYASRVIDTASSLRYKRPLRDVCLLDAGQGLRDGANLNLRYPQVGQDRHTMIALHDNKALSSVHGFEPGPTDVGIGEARRPIAMDPHFRVKVHRAPEFFVDKRCGRRTAESRGESVLRALACPVVECAPWIHKQRQWILYGNAREN